MKKIAYLEMYENEMTHGWYVSTRKLMIHFLKKHSKDKSEMKILDAGCGTGGTIKFLQKAGFKNVAGIDNSSMALELCRARGLKNVTPGSVNKLPFKNRSFGGVICLDVLYHKGVNPKATIKEFNRVLKKNGLLYLQEPAFNWLRGKHDDAIDTAHRFKKKEIQELIESSKFKIIKCTYFNTLFFPLIAVKRLTGSLLNAERLSSDVKEFPKPINTLLIKVLGLEKALLNNINLPFGLSVVCLAKKE